jgi:hypothetical protein
MNQIRYGATPAHVHVRQLDYTAAKELEHILDFVPKDLPLAIKELPEEKIKISWEIENGK